MTKNPKKLRGILKRGDCNLTKEMTARLTKRQQRKVIKFAEKLLEE